MELKGRMTTHDVRSNFRSVVDYIYGKGKHVVVTRAGKPVIAMIPYEDFSALIEELEDLHDVRSAERALEEGVKEGDPVALRVMERRREAAVQDQVETLLP